MKIAINGRFQGRRRTGVDRYAEEIVRRLGEDARLLSPRRSARGAQGQAWEQLVLPRRVRADEVLWSPANSGPISLKNHVVTIHDVSALQHPEWFSPKFALWYRIMLPALASRARHIITVSEHSRRAIMQTMGVRSEKITVVPNGVTAEMFTPRQGGRVRMKYRLPERYILFVGSIDPRKNLGRLLQAWGKIDRPGCTGLVIAGEQGLAFRDAKLQRRVPNVQFLGYVPDEDLPQLYAEACAFVMPSLLEGFGLTVLEAMACGTPVLASTAGALPEVAGGAAVLFDPTSIEAMAGVMSTVLHDDCLRDDLRQRGLDRARSLTWDRAAQQVREILVRSA